MNQAFYEDLVVGVIAALVLSVLTWLVTLIRDLLVRRRYPVAGRYASEYEDHVDGAIVKTKAVTLLHQRGRKIWGTAENIGDVRKWRLEGRISRGGRVFGTYDSADPHDEGLGGFFLELKSDGRLEGMWSGYDSVNRSVEAGRYNFWPLRDIAVRPMSMGDVNQALALLGESLGHRYITAKGLAQFARGEGERCASVATIEDGTVVGAATGQVVHFSKLEQALPAGSFEDTVRAVPMLEYHQVGILKSVAVSPRARGTGVATRLTQEVSRALWERDATCIMTIGWTDKDGCHIRGVVEGLGYEEVATVPGFWTHDSIVEGYDCPSCGNPCSCSAILFVAKRPDFDRSQARS